MNDFSLKAPRLIVSVTLGRNRGCVLELYLILSPQVVLADLKSKLRLYFGETVFCQARCRSSTRSTSLLRFFRLLAACLKLVFDDR
jgi:hypothetical protein